MPGERVAGREIVVGIATYQDAATIADIVRTVSGSLAASGRAVSLVIADGSSTDRTVVLAQEAAGTGIELVSATYARPPVDPLRMPYHGVPGRQGAIRAVLHAAVERDARACVFLDGRLTSVTDDWIPRLAEPALAGEYDYVSPYYSRLLFEGALTRSVVYPVFRALYGVRLRQPATGEFGCSATFMRHVLSESFWESEGAQTAIDLRLASSAIVGRLRVCEAALGTRRHRALPDAPDLTATVEQVLGALFTDVEAHVDTWQRTRGSSAVPCFGQAARATPPPDVDVEPMFGAFRLGYRALREVWASILSPRAILELRKMADAAPAQLRMRDELWAEIVYDFALAYRARSLPREHLLGSFTPLYQGWLAAFITEVRSGAPGDPEERLERLCLTFETKKAHLIAGWRWPSRFRA